MPGTVGKTLVCLSQLSPGSAQAHCGMKQTQATLAQSCCFKVLYSVRLKPVDMYQLTQKTSWLIGQTKAWTGFYVTKEDTKEEIAILRRGFLTGSWPTSHRAKYPGKGKGK